MKITRINHLLRAYFIENKKILLIFSLATFATLAWVYTVSTYPELTLALPYFFMLFIAGRFFQSSLKKSNSTHFFNLPVTNGERLASALTILIVSSIALYILAVAGAYIGHHFIRPILFPEANMRFYNNDMSVWSTIAINFEFTLYLVAAISIFLFGSIYFKKKAFWRTIACCGLFLFAVALYNMILLLIAFGNMNMFIGGDYTFDITSRSSMLHTSFYDILIYIILCILTFFFLSLTYLRLRETEV
jgi:hypothetical protein